MFPVFRLKLVLGKGEEAKVVIECGNRNIEFRGATGEKGPEGPFPFITLTEEGGKMEIHKSGFCIHSVAIFNELWDQLKDLAEK